MLKTGGGPGTDAGAADGTSGTLRRDLAAAEARARQRLGAEWAREDAKAAGRKGQAAGSAAPAERAAAALAEQQARVRAGLAADSAEGEDPLS